jgi:hypothetical protein
MDGNREPDNRESPDRVHLFDGYQYFLISGRTDRPGSAWALRGLAGITDSD